MAILTVAFTTDFQNDTTLSDITEIAYLNASGLASAIFANHQFDGNPISTSVLITGSNGNNAVVVFGGSIDASGWTFANWGLAGTDTISLNGTASSDTLVGTANRDTLDGDANGTDTLRGGLGRDNLIGGIGIDTFVYGDPAEIETGEQIFGSNSTDSIRLTGAPGFHNFANATISNVETLVLQGTSHAILASGQIGGAAGLINTVIGNPGGGNLLNIEGSSTNLTGVGITNATPYLLGTAGADTLTGSSANDAIFGFGGLDQMFGGAGDNVFSGLSDTFFQAGETINGGPGSQDRISISSGDYNFTGVAISGVEVLFVNFTGGGDSARFNPAQFGGASGIAKLIGTGNGGDILIDGAAIDVSTVDATTFVNVDFILTGTAAANTIIGNADERNVITGGGAGDTMTGGGLDDTFVYKALADVAAGESIAGGAGSLDRIELQNTGPGELQLDDVAMSGVEVLAFAAGSGGARLLSSQIGGAGTIQTVFGSADINYINVTGSVANLSSLAFSGWSDGSDKVTLVGTSGVDTLTGSDVADTFFANTGADALNGRIGNDEFLLLNSGGGVAASIDGGGGTDALIFQSAQTRDFTGSSLAGLEALQASAPAIGATIALAFAGSQIGGSRINAISTTLNDNLALTVRGAAINLTGLTFTGWSDGADTMTLEGTTGGDSIVGSAERDTVNGGDGNDTVYGGLDNDTLNGGLGGDRLEGQDGLDGLNGDAGIDTLLGGAGNDVIAGGADADKMYGQDGRDIVNAGTGNDLVYGGEETGAGDILLSGAAGDDHIQGGGGNDVISGDENNDKLYGEAGDDQVFGGIGNDRLEGGADNDTLGGEDGNDVMTGGTGIDTMTGGQGVDRLDGNDGNDTLDGGTENDNLTGNAGLDIYNFEAATASDSVFGFEDDIDTLRVDPSYGFADAAAVVAATISTQGHARIILGGGNQIYLWDYIANGGSVASLLDDIAIA